ncbi:MAG: DNA mismatch repair protein MutS [Candidatus Heimdallarchaeota archaeon]
MSDTPMVKQYHDLKRKCNNAILFFQVGDFYETFEEDAKLVSQELGIILTFKDKEKMLPMAGVPVHGVGPHIKKLVNRGYKVAICDQVEKPSPKKKLVKREIVRIITPGTIFDIDMLDAKVNNYLAALVRGKIGYGLSLVDLSTGTFQTTYLPGKSAFNDLITEFSRYPIQECLLPRSLSENQGFMDSLHTNIPYDIYFSPLEDYLFDPDYAEQTLLDHFGIAHGGLDGYGCGNLPLAISAAGAIISYLKETQKAPLTNIQSLKTHSISKYVILDSSTIQNLEILENIRDKSSRGTLLSILDHTLTRMGSRLLKQWITHPLREPEKIQSRLEAVEELFKDIILRKGLTEVLMSIHDLERIISRLNYLRTSPKDMILLKTSLQKVPELTHLLKDVNTPYLKIISKDLLTESEDIVSLIDKAIVDDPPQTLTEGGIIKDRFNKQLDELREIIKTGKNWLIDLEKTERKRTGIKNLRMGFNRTFGYYIEVTKSNLNKVPNDYIRRQTLVNAERFITPALKDWEEKILNAEEKINDLEYAIFIQIRDEICNYTELIQQTAHSIAKLDVICSFAEIAIQSRYTKPQVDDADIIEIKKGRHPVVEQLINEDFIPNDSLLDCSGNQISIVTGPNMAGKSTFIRQIALIVLMAQIGSFVPADMARIGIVDRIFSRIGAVDDITRRQSTFMVEMTETANILNNATSKSLIILDEIGRGTSTFDGMAIAWAVVEYIHNKIGVRTMLATHYRELVQLSDLLPRINNYNVSVLERGGKMIFIRRVVPGPSDRSYGVQVAKLAGLPPEVIKRASEVLEKIESQSQIQIPILSEATPPPTRDVTSSVEPKTSDDEPILDLSKTELPSIRISPVLDKPRASNKSESAQIIKDARKKKKQTILTEFDLGADM